MPTASPTARLEATLVSVERLRQTAGRQEKQLKLEQKGARKQQRPPSPRGSRPWLRAKAEKDKKKADIKAVILKEKSDAEAQERAVQEADEAAQRQFETDAAEQLERETAAAQKLAQELAEAVAAAEDPNTTRGKWASAEWELVNALLSSRKECLDMGGFMLAQTLARTSTAWRSSCKTWCKDLEVLPFRGGDGWDACTFGQGAMGAVSRTAPKVRDLHLEAFDKVAMSELNKLAGLLDTLTLTLCTGVGAILEAVSFPKLKTLKLENCRDVSAEGLKQLASDSKDLRSLHLEGCAVGGAALAFARNLPRKAGGAPQGALQFFSCDQHLTDEVLRALTRACPNIEELTLYAVGSSVALKQLAMHSTQLRRLQLFGGEKLIGSKLPWRDEEIEALAEGCPKLTQLRLEHGANSPLTGAFLYLFSELTDLSLAHLGSVSELSRSALLALWQSGGTRLTRIDLSGCRVDDCGMLAELVSTCSALEHLECAGIQCELPVGSFESIACTGLKHLGLSATGIANADIGCALQECGQLTSLDVSATTIDDTTLGVIKHFAAPRLTRLGLMRCERATRAGLTNLVEACRYLDRRVDEGNQLTVEAFVEAMSNVSPALAVRSEVEPEPDLPDVSEPKSEKGGLSSGWNEALELAQELAGMNLRHDGVGGSGLSLLPLHVTSEPEPELEGTPRTSLRLIEPEPDFD